MNYYLLGVIFGILVGAAVWLLTRIFRRKNQPDYYKYDERQALARGKAFAAGFYTLLIANAAVSIWEALSGGLPGNPLPWHCGALMLGVCVFAVTAIFRDAYVGMYDTTNRFIQMGCLFIIAMSLSGISNLYREDEFGRVFAILNLEIAVVWVIIVISLLLRRYQMKQEEDA